MAGPCIPGKEGAVEVIPIGESETVAPEHFLVHLPDSISYEIAASTSMAIKPGTSHPATLCARETERQERIWSLAQGVWSGRVWQPQKIGCNC